MRYPVAAGTFYPSEKRELKKVLDIVFSKVKPKSYVSNKGRNTLGIIVPHAGYVYSGFIAARAYIELPRKNDITFLIIGPNHTGLGVSVSLCPEDYWLTPFGEVKINEKIAKKIVEKSKYAMFDELAHLNEHSIEVQLPFLQYLFGNSFSIVPVCLMDQSKEIALDLARTIISLKENIIVIASSDFTHYEPKEIAEKKDKMLIKEIESLNLERFYRTLHERNISACGYGAIATLMEYTRIKKGKIVFLDYATSGDITGDFSSVVGYASMVSLQ